MLDAMHLESFLLRGGAEVAFEIAAWVQRLAAPVGRRQQRHFHPRPVRCHCLEVVVVSGCAKQGLAHIVAVGTHLLGQQRSGAKAQDILVKVGDIHAFLMVLSTAGSRNTVLAAQSRTL